MKYVDHPQPVAPEHEMDAETFRRHFQARHMPLAGLTRLEPPIANDPDERTLRAYHRRLHSQPDNSGLAHWHPREMED